MNIRQTFRVHSLIFLLLCSLLVANEVVAQPNPPQIDCASEIDSQTRIYWNFNPNTDCNGAASFEGYILYRSATLEGPFVEIATISNSSPYDDSDGSSDFYYYLTIRCDGVESLPSDTVFNDRPFPPEIINTTVLPDGTVQVAFLPSVSSGVSGYGLTRSEDGAPFQAVEDANFDLSGDTLYVTDPTIDAREAAVGYSLRAFTCSELENLGGLSDAHFTVFVEAGVDNCQDVVSLSWTPYIGWNREVDGVLIDSVSTYTIYTDTDTNTVNAPITNFTYTISPNTSDKCFKIVANNTQGLSSESNEVCINRAATNPPTDICLRFLSIDSVNNQVVLEWNIDETTDITNLQIYRGLSSEGLQLLGALPDDAPSFSGITDPVDIQAGPYFYQIVHIDDCGRRVESNIGNTVDLNGRNQLDGSNLLAWNDLNIGEGAIVTGYTLYRSEETPFKNFQVIENLDANTFEFRDELGNVENSDLSYCYYVETQYSLTCNDGTTSIESSISNEICISQSPRMFVPNAFAPNGVNKIFKPILRNPNPNDYQMVVFNRWGEHVFTTADPDEGWDGFHNGKLAPQGVYAYYIRMQTELGFVLERKGTVVLVR